MISIAPVFNGSYDGHRIYSNTNNSSGNIEKYIDSVEIVLSPPHFRQRTGFADVVYSGNTSGENIQGEMTIQLVGDLPQYLTSFFIQLSKSFLGSGMDLLFYDGTITGKQYTGKWDNACDFVENDAVTSTGIILLKFYKFEGI